MLNKIELLELRAEVNEWKYKDSNDKEIKGEIYEKKY